MKKQIITDQSQDRQGYETVTRSMLCSVCLTTQANGRRGKERNTEKTEVNE
jgi:hypothetical protein